MFYVNIHDIMYYINYDIMYDNIKHTIACMISYDAYYHVWYHPNKLLYCVWYHHAIIMILVFSNESAFLALMTLFKKKLWYHIWYHSLFDIREMIRYDITKTVIKCPSCAFSWIIAHAPPSLFGKGGHILLLLGGRRGFDVIYGIILIIIIIIIIIININININIITHMILHMTLAVISYVYDII